MTIDRLYKLFLHHNGISTDTRKIIPGTLFFALKGDHFNGNDFAEDALKSGASYAVVDENKPGLSDKCILVDDVLKTLQQLAVHHRNRFSIPVIAITGTNGKTTTKELCHAVLSQKYNALATPGNFNNHIGVPLTLLSITGQTGIAIIEMGANHPGEVDFLCSLANPGFGIITNIGKAHLEGFGSFEGIVQTKTEMYRYLKNHSGTIFLNTDNKLLTGHAAGITSVTYGTNAEAGLRGTEITAGPFVHLTLTNAGKTYEAESRLYGTYNAENIMAAACVGFYFGVKAEKICSAISAYQPSNNRSQVVQTEHNLLVLDAYNANPSSMELAITGFVGNKCHNPVLILGDMFELGSESDSEHRNILDLVKRLGIEDVYLVGPVFTRLNTERNWHCFYDSELARTWFEHHPILDSSILIKGSRGMKLETIVPLLG